ncbi:hypothetical protein JYT51_02390 [Candidatus Amoebophilus asiaticus]|nr:hypothetical protein [Candidatus Amoebophilus asiaticus]
MKTTKLLTKSLSFLLSCLFFASEGANKTKCADSEKPAFDEYARSRNENAQACPRYFITYSGMIIKE